MTPIVLVPFDFSPASEHALAWATDLVRSVGGGALHVVHVLDVAETVPTLEPHAAPSVSDPRAEKTIRTLNDVVFKHDAAATCEVALAPSVGDAVLSIAKKRGVNLIAIATHGTGGIKLPMLGSVADYVVRHAECPVVTMRMPAAH